MLTAQTVCREMADLPKSDKAHHPAPAAPVRLQGRMTPAGYQAENSAWRPFLTRPDPGLGERHDGTPRLAGLDPMKDPAGDLDPGGTSEPFDGRASLRALQLRSWRSGRSAQQGPRLSRHPGILQRLFRRCALTAQVCGDQLSLLGLSHGAKSSQPTPRH